MRLAKDLGFGLIAYRDGEADLSKLLHACAQVDEHSDTGLRLADLIQAQGAIDPSVRARIEIEVERFLNPSDGADTTFPIDLPQQTVPPTLFAPPTLAPGSRADSRDSVELLTMQADSVSDSPETETLPPSPSEEFATLPPSDSSSPTVRAVKEPAQQQQPWGSRYAIERYHDKGGLGMIWVARDLILDRVVALKEIKSDWVGHYESRRRFTREAQITGQLSHPGIVQVYDLGERGDDGRPFYVMRFVGGRTMHTVIREYHTRKRKEGQDDPVAFRELLGMFVAVCRTMAYAHGQGIVHRDLKPVNVMVGNFGEIVVLDWGLAKRLHRPSDTREIATLDSGLIGLSGDVDEKLTHGSLIGTPQYMPPEQAQGLNSIIDEKSDIYSLGVTLFEILTGQNLWDGENQIGQILARIVSDPTPSARARDGAVSKSLDAICAKALAKRKEDRYDNAADLAEDVQRYLAGEPVSAYPEPITDRFRRWTRKHRTKFAAVTVALALILIFGAYLANEASVERAKRMTRGHALAQAVLAADIGYVGNLVKDLAEYRSAADPTLREAWTKSGDHQRKLRAGLALLPVDPSTAPELAEMLLQASPEEVLVIRGFLEDYAPRSDLQTLIDRYAKVIDAPDGDAKLRAAAALALFASDDSRWPRWGSTIADPLARENPLTMKSWSLAFKSVGDSIVEQLSGIFRNAARSESERINATNLIRDYARQPRGLAEVVSLAEGDLFETAANRLANQREEAIPYLEAMLKRSAMPKWSDPPSVWSPPDRATIATIEQARGLVAERFAIAQTLAGQDVARVCEVMGRAGYRPLKLSPSHDANGEVHAVVVWTRDGRPWRIAWDIDPSTAEHLNRRHQAEGLQPIDASGWTEVKAGSSGDVRHAAAWGPAMARARVDWSLNVTQMVEASHEMYPRKEEPRSIALWTGPDGQSRGTVVWAPQSPNQEPVALLVNSRESEIQVWLNEQSKWPMDIAVGRAGADQVFQPNRIFQDAEGMPDLGRVYAGIWLGRASIEARTMRGLAPAEALAQAKSWAAEGWRPISAALSISEGPSSQARPGAAGAIDEGMIVAQVWQRPAVPEVERLALALRQSRAAIVLARLGRPDLVWPLLKRSVDPTLRSQIIRDWARLGADPRPLIDRLRSERDVSIRQALILALGEFEPKRLAPLRSESALDSWLLADYKREPDAGVHGAIDWLLRQRLGAGSELNDLNKRSRDPQPKADRDWFINSQGQTFSVIRGPLSFWMGSALSTDYYRPEENRHFQLIDRSYAIAAREVTVREYARYLAENPEVQDERQVRITQASESQSESPMTILDWYDAARYCNWLSEKDGLPQSEWCYPPELNRDDIRTRSWNLTPDMLKRKGYRLPTEAEWEFACRAGSESRWHHGFNEELLSRYAWFQGNSGNRPHSVGTLLPNVFGLFDMAGNADEWTNGVYRGRYNVQGSVKGAFDQIDDKPFSRDDLHVLRGGTFYENPLGLRPAERGRSQAAYRSAGFGIRVARTCP